MIIITLIFILLFWLIPFVLDHLKFFTVFIAYVLSILFLVNDYDSTIVSDNIVKLSTILSISMFTLIMFNQIYHGDD